MSIGQFESFVNGIAYTGDEKSRALMVEVAKSAAAALGPGDTPRWAGSISRSTAIRGSDLDIWVRPATPVTPASRRAFAESLQSALGRSVTIRSHVVRISPTASLPRVDVAFGNAAFGPRRAPDDSSFSNRRDRQAAARALKAWLRAGGLPPVRGWAIEALIVGMDRGRVEKDGLTLLLDVLAWTTRVDAGAVESLLRPVTERAWEPAWSRTLPGVLEAVANQARRSLSQRDRLLVARSTADIEAWVLRK